MLKKSINTMIITMVSRVLGLFRGTLVAYFFGASVLTDAYYSAFKISNFFRQLLGEGALGNTFIPLYHKKKKEEGEERSREYIFSVLNITFFFRRDTMLADLNAAIPPVTPTKMFFIFFSPYNNYLSLQ